MSKEVTLVIPVYNAAPYLETCVNSVLAQTYPNIDCLLIDDGSTDDSPALLDRMAAAHPDRLRVIHQPNAGVAAARNLGIQLARGEYLMFADNDDFMVPDYVSHMVQELEAADADMVVSGFHRVSEDGRILFTHRLTQDPWSKFRAVAPWGRILRTDFVRQHHLQFGNFRVGEDSYFTICAYEASSRIVTTDYIGYHWMDRPSSVSNTIQKRSDIASALPMLTALQERITPPQILEPELLDYFFIKHVVWHLTYIAKDTARPVVASTCETYFAWLKDHVPGYRKNPQVSLCRPKGELLGIRFTVWLLVKSPMWLKKVILTVYGAL